MLQTPKSSSKFNTMQRGTVRMMPIVISHCLLLARYGYSNEQTSRAKSTHRRCLCIHYIQKSIVYFHSADTRAERPVSGLLVHK